MSKIQSCTKHNDGYIRWSEGEVCPLCKLQSQLAAEIEANRWIPVGERLPGLEDGACQSKWVDATNGIRKHEGYYYDYTGREPMSGAATGKGWYCHGIGKVTHWRPITLPEGE